MDALAKVCPECGRRYDAVAVFCQRDGTRLLLIEPPRDSYIGQTLLDQFKIEEKIGAGGMGSVYRARQTTLHRDVAIKILHPELADNRDAVRRFKREARVCTALDHPNVVRVFLFGQLSDGSLYIVMEFLRGRSLLEVIQRDGALPVHRGLHVATQICDGVGEAHAQGVVHRDLKPENVVLVNKARDPDFVKVLDFGIARVLWGDEVTQATQSGLVFGTARYISPEGAAGEATDARSDVYSLGVLTYQLLSGDTPFDAPSPVAMLMKHIHATPAHLRSQERARHVPEPVADVIMRALSKNPEGRYDDAHAFGDALRSAAVRSGFEVHGRPPAGSLSITPGPSSNPELRRPVERPRSGYAEHPWDREPSGARERSDPTPTPSMCEPPRRMEGTLEGAPSPFDHEEEEPSIPGLVLGHSRRHSGMVRIIGLSFVVGVVLVAGGSAIRAWLQADEEAPPRVDVEMLAEQARDALGREAYDEPPGISVLALTDRILAVRPDHPEALRLREEVADRLVRQAEEAAERGEPDEARALYRRAKEFRADDTAIEEALLALDVPVEPPPAPGVRTRPPRVVEGQAITLVAVLEDPDVGSREQPRFLLKRGGHQIGRSIEATRTEDGYGYEARTTIARAGTYQLLFRIGRGAGRIEQTAEIEVERDPNRPVRPREPDPPPVTTQGSVWQPPSIAPAWTPIPASPPAAPSDPRPSIAQPEPPPPPAPWRGGGSVL